MRQHTLPAPDRVVAMDNRPKASMLRPNFMARPVNPRPPTPAALGFSMPAEWESHEATWLGWPHNSTDWPDKLDTIRWVYGEMVRKIAAGETVRMLVRHKADEKLARRQLLVGFVPDQHPD